MTAADEHRPPRRRRRVGTAEALLAEPGGVSQPIRSHLPRLEFLTAGQVEQIHAASLSILSRTGLVVTSDEALAVYAHGGARVDRAVRRVFLERDLVEQALSTAPDRYILHARNPAHTVTVGGEGCVVMPAGGPPYVRDLEGVRRPGTLADLENFTRLSAMSPEVHVLARKAVEAQDVPVAVRHLACWRAVLLLADKPVTAGFVGGRPEAEDALQMLAALWGGESALDGHPVAQCSINVNSPLLYDKAMVEGMLAFVRLGQPVIISPFVMAGVMGPATLAGALAQHNAEVLAGVVLAQLAQPGTPVVYGTATSNTDLRSGAPAIGSPESGISVAVCAQMARRYRLPCRGGGALTDSPVPDAQSNYERMMLLMTSVLSGVNFMMHGLGVLESYLTVCYEQFVIDLELIGMLRALVQPLEISAETLALDTIDAVGPGGFFLDAPHTLRHHRHAHFLPRISQRLPHDQWVAAGRQDAAQRANRRCRELLEAYVQPPVDSAAAGRLEDFIERRWRELSP
jgi:trimethylamine--corrinoid protein Co-methyltransferase